MNDSSKPKAYRHAIKVQESDIDELGHVNNVVYLRWVQEVAAAHWEHVATDAMKKQYVWVVLRHEIDYLMPAFSGDEIMGYTWIGSHKGAKVERLVSLYKAGSKKPIAEAKTSWCLLDAESKRPRRIDAPMVNSFQQYIQAD